MKPWFNARKAAQVAAFFVQQEGGAINVLKLTKLIYLADRRHMGAYDYPILNDELVAMPHGPVNSMTFDYINGFELDRDGWDEFIEGRAGYTVALASSLIHYRMLDELSEAEITTLNETWAEFGPMNKYKIRDWTHQNCPEWEDPGRSSSPIPYERVFKFLGKKHAEELAEEIEEARKLSKIFAAQ